MELILNLLWLMLALPAYWLWRREAASAQPFRRLGSRHCVLVLSCILVLLFPVVSATDDLHFMRSEMEESSPSKRTLRLAAGDRNFHSMPLAPPAQTVSSIPFVPADPAQGLVFIENALPVPVFVLKTLAARAPPTLPLV